MKRIGLASVALLMALLTFAFGAQAGLAADYQDAKHNVCEGTFSFPPCTEWGSHVTGSENVALGDAMMPALTSGSGNVALDFGALEKDTTGSNNIASGPGALFSNTEGFGNIASGFHALFNNTTGNHNIASGYAALLLNTTGGYNVASGTAALAFNTTGFRNIAIGRDALRENTGGDDNVASGTEALEHNTTGSFNVALGREAGDNMTTGGYNVAIGRSALFNSTGSFNVAVGREAGQNLTTGSNNIDIANAGVAAEERTTRIGTEGNQTRAFIAGVYNKPVTTPACAVKVNSEGQLGCNEEGPGNGAVATFASRKKVLSGQCLAYTGIGPAGTGACAAKTTGFSSSTRLAPMPANGGAVTNLYADSSAAISGSDTVLVAVIDNTTGATLLSCTVDSTTQDHCSNASGSGSAAADDNIEVKLTITGASGNEKLWRVTFRF